MSIVTLDTVDSTNTYALRHFDEIPDGTLVYAREQTAGRGRLGRVWYSRPGESLTVSAVFKRVQEGFHGGVILSLAVLNALQKLLPELPVYLKWPNDLYVRSAKLAGVLCEGAHFEAGRTTGVVAGIGVNLNLTAEALSRTGGEATSLKAETGREFSPDFFLSEVENSLNAEYIKYSKNLPLSLARWREKNALSGERVAVVNAAGERFAGVFEAIAEDGGMLIRCEDKLLRFSCGDVSVDRSGVDWMRIAEKVKKEQYVLNVTTKHQQTKKGSER